MRQETTTQGDNEVVYRGDFRRSYYGNDELIQSVFKRSNQLVGIDRYHAGTEKLLFNHNASSVTIVSKSTKISCYSILLKMT